MKLGYQLAHEVLVRNVCLQVDKMDAARIAAFLSKQEIYDASPRFKGMVDSIKRGDLTSLERAAEMWNAWLKLEGGE